MRFKNLEQKPEKESSKWIISYVMESCVHLTWCHNHSSNMVSKSCSKLSHANRILKCRTKDSKRKSRRHSKKMTKTPKERGVEPQLRGDVLCSRGGVG